MRAYVTTVSITLLLGQFCMAAPQRPRGCKVCVSDKAPAALQRLAERIVAHQKKHATLKTLSDGQAIRLASTEELLSQPWEQRAFTHLVVIGMADDELVQQVWQNEADIDNDRIYVHGVGYLEGDIGFIESERNPFLYSPQVHTAPYTAMVITITGTTVKGVSLAANAFLDQGLTNGVVAGDGWRRTEETILDSEPLAASFQVPKVLPRRVGPWQLVGLTACPEPDYRGVLAQVGAEPLEMWRSKYHKPGEWDLPGSKNSFMSYLASLHRRAYGNSLLVMRFADQQTAGQARGRIAAGARLRQSRDGMMIGVQPIPSSKGFRDPGNPDLDTWNAPFSVWATGEWVFLSSLPIDVSSSIRQSD